MAARSEYEEDRTRVDVTQVSVPFTWLQGANSSTAVGSFTLGRFDFGWKKAVIGLVATFFFAGGCFDLICLSQWNRDAVVLALPVFSPKSLDVHPGSQHRTPRLVTSKVTVTEPWT